MELSDNDRPLSRSEASDAVAPIGWRYLLGTVCASVPVVSLSQGAIAAGAAVAAAGADADAHLRIDLRPGRVELSVQTRAVGAITVVDVELARRITAALMALGFSVAAVRADAYARPVAMLEIAIDAMDISAIRPFWKAALAYVDDVSDPGPAGGLVDPVGQQPTLWFQQMDVPRPQRNRIHFDVTVAHDEAEARVAAVVAAGGQLIDDSHARRFWILADPEGNECCICTWTDRDEWDSSLAES
jgi:4a-hydroxytetrahydrobiopterin dehydratase